jgi:hypothetical protein
MSAEQKSNLNHGQNIRKQVICKKIEKVVNIFIYFIDRKMTGYAQTFSLTFGDVAENHKGMQKIGQLSNYGFNFQDLTEIKRNFEASGCECNIINLHLLLDDEDAKEKNPAYLLVVKNAVNVLLDDDNGKNALYEEQDALEKDTKAFMYGRVVNKHARHNLCFSEENQEPNYEEGKGRVYAFDDVPLLKRIRERLGVFIGEKGANLQAEGNYYYDVNKCGIGFHGDAERKKVVAIRLGATIPLCYTWYHYNKNISNVMRINNIEHGDMYIMSEKATGFDWKSKSKYTLRHAAGCNKYTNV